MKATIVSTNSVVMICDPQGYLAHARVWEGVSEKGVPFVAYITSMQVHRSQDCAEFERDLQEHKAPATLADANEVAEVLPRLWSAIVEATTADSAFWLGEILLSEITKETGYIGPRMNGHG